MDYSPMNFTRSRDQKRSDVHVTDLGCVLRLVEATDAYLIETDDRRIYKKCMEV